MHEQLVFGWDPMWVASLLFVCTYLLVVTDWVNRTIVAALGAGLMVALGVLEQQEAVAGIDFNTIGLLMGMMVMVTITRRSGVFQFIAIWSAKKLHARPWGILVMLSVLTALFSALLDNVTTVLIMVPITLLITRELGVDPYPFLFSEIFASNIGGASTLIGDPPNIMIGSAVNLNFNDFLINLAPVTIVVLVLTLGVIYLIWGRGMRADRERRHRVMSLNEREAITDVVLLYKSAVVLGVVMVTFVMAPTLGLEPATIALLGAAVLLFVTNVGTRSDTQSQNVQQTFGEIEWTVIFFFAGLFIVVHGLEHVGILDLLAREILNWTGGDITMTTIAILWFSAIASTLVDNIPFVATMIPLIESMGDALGGPEALTPLWWALALGSCLGGNGSLIGSGANLIVAGMAERGGVPIRFLTFLGVAFPLMIGSILVASVYVYFRFL
jgi:Na+/H+ antiporter NhaD/arsenite permease-like protein